MKGKSVKLSAITIKSRKVQYSTAWQSKVQLLFHLLFGRCCFLLFLGAVLVSLPLSLGGAAFFRRLVGGAAFPSPCSSFFLGGAVCLPPSVGWCCFLLCACGWLFIHLPFPLQHVSLSSVFLHRGFLSFPASDGKVRMSHCFFFGKDQSLLRMTPQSETLRQYRFGCVDAGTLFTGREPKERNNGSEFWSESTAACMLLRRGKRKVDQFRHVQEEGRT